MRFMKSCVAVCIAFGAAAMLIPLSADACRGSFVRTARWQPTAFLISQEKKNLDQDKKNLAQELVFTNPLDGNSVTLQSGGLVTHGKINNLSGPMPGILSYVTTSSGAWKMWTGVPQTVASPEWEFLHSPAPDFDVDQWYTATVQTMTEDIMTTQCVFKLIEGRNEPQVVARAKKTIRPDPATKIAISVDRPPPTGGELKKNQDYQVRGTLMAGYEHHYVIAVVFRKSDSSKMRFAQVKKTGEEFRLVFPQSAISTLPVGTDYVVRVMLLDPTIHPTDINVKVVAN